MERFAGWEKSVILCGPVIAVAGDLIEIAALNVRFKGAAPHGSSPYRHFPCLQDPHEPACVVKCLPQPFTFSQADVDERAGSTIGLLCYQRPGSNQSYSRKGK